MANEFQHKDPGSSLTQSEYITTDGTGHIFDCQATGDIMYASSTTVLKNLAKGSENEILSMGDSCIPDWTSTPTLAALTVDDVAINGKVVTMTGSACDTIVMTAAANGAFSLVTTDTAAAAANIQITADGTVDIDSAGVLTLDSGAAINIEPAAGSAILLDGTISIDGAAITGATSILATDIKIGEDDETKVDFACANIINLHANNIKALSVHNTSSKGELRFYEAGNYVGFAAPALSGDQIWTLPTADGSAGTVLTTDSCGVLSWAAAGGIQELSTAVRNFIDNGNSEVLYFMGGSDWRVLTEAGNKSVTNFMGLGLTAQASSSAYVQSSTTIRGGWQLISHTGNTTFAAAITIDDLDPTDDWTILWRGVVPSAATQVFQVGMVSASTWSPPNENNQIGIRVVDTGNFFGYTDSGGTETTLDLGVAPSTTIRSLKIVITGDGGSVEYFIDDVSIGSITANIPTGTTFLIQSGIETRTTATREIHVADFAAYREG